MLLVRLVSPDTTQVSSPFIAFQKRKRGIHCVKPRENFVDGNAAHRSCSMLKCDERRHASERVLSSKMPSYPKVTKRLNSSLHDELDGGECVRQVGVPDRNTSGHSCTMPRHPHRRKHIHTDTHAHAHVKTHVNLHRAHFTSANVSARASTRKNKTHMRAKDALSHSLTTANQHRHKPRRYRRDTLSLTHTDKHTFTTFTLTCDPWSAKATAFTSSS